MFIVSGFGFLTAKFATECYTLFSNLRMMEKEIEKEKH